MKIVYVSGAYRSRWGFIGVLINILKARRIAHKIWMNGDVAICPHLNTAFFPHKPPEFWIAGDLLILEKCDSIYMMKGWVWSKGSVKEYLKASELKLKIMFEE